MREIIGGFMDVVLKHYNIPATLTYSGDIGHHANFEVWELDEENYETLCSLTDEEWDAIASEDSWWRGSDGCILGTPNEEFVINEVSIFAWRNESRCDDLEEEWNELDEEEKSEYGDLEGYCSVWLPISYKDLFEYFCDEMGVSTERNICALSVDLAKYNNITMAELFRRYGGEKKYD